MIVRELVHDLCFETVRRCIAISTEASLREMVLPGFLVMVTPVLAGTFLGVEAVSGLSRLYQFYIICDLYDNTLVRLYYII